MFELSKAFSLAVLIRKCVAKNIILDYKLLSILNEKFNLLKGGKFFFQNIGHLLRFIIIILYVNIFLQQGASQLMVISIC